MAQSECDYWAVSGPALTSNGDREVARALESLAKHLEADR